ncbi:hypothetical protein PIB30_031241 [Stylosanthes scabra]|uniref:Uncharacterized protein n=1 Tax=Stylosanthes scabra TaxID=79078 RepID=A0ABU6VAZ8_9FABA|nr:hypothetical protein [Stylosanthes scabra]
MPPIHSRRAKGVVGNPSRAKRRRLHTKNRSDRPSVHIADAVRGDLRGHAVCCRRRRRSGGSKEFRRRRRRRQLSRRRSSTPPEIRPPPPPLTAAVHCSLSPPLASSVRPHHRRHCRSLQSSSKEKEFVRRPRSACEI